MDITRILNIGIGKCGNNLVNTLMSKDSEYKGFMIGTNGIDIFSFDNSSRANVVLVPCNDDTKELVDFDITNEFANWKDDYDFFMLYFSMDEEFGSKYVENVARAIRKVKPRSKIIAIALISVDPATSIKPRCENVIKCWDMLMDLSHEIIDEFRFIDTTRKSTDEIN